MRCRTEFFLAGERCLLNEESITVPLDIEEQHELAVETQRSKKIVLRRDDGNRQKIVVDAREFRSKFPAALHGASFELIQSTLKVRQ